MNRVKMYLLWGAAVWMTACTDEVTEEPWPPLTTDSVAVIFDLPQCYAYAGLSTRAGGETDTVGTDTLRYFQTTAWPHHSLAEESTVWISYRKYLGVATNGTDSFGNEVMKPYVVRGLGDGYLSLYACQTRDSTCQDTVWELPDLTQVNATPLYLETGRYNFRILSPALAITNVDNQNYSAVVTNGMYFCSSDERYENTRGLNFTVSTTTTGVQRIELNPMVWQVARLSFTLRKDSGVSDLTVMSTGIEVSGLQNPLVENVATGTADRIYYNWRSGSESDTIQMRLADKRSWVRIAGSDCVTQSDGTITADVGVLPTDAMSTNIVMLFNLSVNGIATQYETCLKQIRLFHGHDYHVTVTVKGADDITVSNWSNQSWTVDAPFR